MRRGISTVIQMKYSCFY